jgi:transcriptional antiterminator NusG
MEATTQNTPEPQQQESQQQETKWYVLRVVSGKERKVKEYLDKEVSRGGWSQIVKQVFCL